MQINKEFLDTKPQEKPSLFCILQGVVFSREAKGGPPKCTLKSVSLPTFFLTGWRPPTILT